MHAEGSLTQRPGPVDLSVVILTHNTRDLLRTCLDSIREKTHRIRYELIVVDNHSTDGTGEMLAEHDPDVTYLYRDDAYSFAAANNAGLALARGRYWLILNSDTELANDAFDRMVDFLDATPDCGIAGCRLLNSDGSLQLSCRRFPGYMTALFNRYSILTRLFPGNTYSQGYLMMNDDHSATKTVDWVSGACLFVRREAVDEVGLLDGNIVSSTEDVDWCKRMWEAGWKVHYHPEAEVLHHIGRGISQHPYRFFVIKHRSMFYYYRKHLSHDVLVVDTAVLAGLVLRAAFLALRHALVGQGRRESV